MEWFFDNDHVLTVSEVKDDKDQIVTDATVTVQITDQDDTELLNQTMNADGSGNYTLSLADDLLPENYTYYDLKITAEKDSVKGTWVDSLKSQDRRFD